MKAIHAAAALAALPLAAPAATVDASAPGIYTVVDSILPGGSAFLNVLVNGPTKLSFVFAATGKGADVSDITWKIGGTGPAYTWTTVQDFGPIAFGGGTAPQITASSNFFIQFYDGISQLVGLTFTVEAEDVTAVPVPAAGLLAGTGLAGLAALGALKGRRRA